MTQVEHELAVAQVRLRCAAAMCAGCRDHGTPEKVTGDSLAHRWGNHGWIWCMASPIWALDLSIAD